MLPPGGDTGEIKIRFNRADWSIFDQANHYSFAPQTEYTDWQKVTVYFDGQLVWGTEPTGQSATSPTIQAIIAATQTPPASTVPTAAAPAAQLSQPTSAPTATANTEASLPAPSATGRISSAALVLIGLVAGLILGMLVLKIFRPAGGS